MVTRVHPVFPGLVLRIFIAHWVQHSRSALTFIFRQANLTVIAFNTVSACACFRPLFHCLPITLVLRTVLRRFRATIGFDPLVCGQPFPHGRTGPGNLAGLGNAGVFLLPRNSQRKQGHPFQGIDIYLATCHNKITGAPTTVRSTPVGSVLRGQNSEPPSFCCHFAEI